MGMFADLAFYLVIIFILLVVVASAIKILREYERGVVFTLGRFTGVKG
ncbi:slipin family protein, partial [Rhizobium leguminosarum]